MISLRRVPVFHSDRIHNALKMLLNESCCFKEIQEHRRLRIGFGDLEYVHRSRDNKLIPAPVWQLATVRADWCIRSGGKPIVDRKREDKNHPEVFVKSRINRLQSLTSPSDGIVKFHFNNDIVLDVIGSNKSGSDFYLKTPHGIWLEFDAATGWSLLDV